MQDGIYRKSATKYDLAGFRANVDTRVAKNLKIGVDISGRQQHKDYSAFSSDNYGIFYMATKGANGEPDFTACQNASLAKLATTSHKDYRDFQPQHYLVPIPQNEITKSGGKLVQNPGY